MGAVLEKIGNGCYRIDGSRMPLPVENLKVLKPYLAPNSLHCSIEEKDAAVRVLWSSAQNNEWVGVSLRKFAETIAEELDMVRTNRTENLPFSCASIYGARPVLLGVHWLLMAHLLEIDRQDDDLILLPTPALVKEILAA